MSYLALIVDSLVKDSIRKGDFDDFEGKGKPLNLEKETGPEHLRMSNRIMKNAGILPEEMQIRKKMAELRAELKTTKDEAERKKIIKLLLEAESLYNIKMQKHKADIKFMKRL